MQHLLKQHESYHFLKAHTNSDKKCLSRMLAFNQVHKYCNVQVERLKKKKPLNKSRQKVLKTADLMQS